MRRIAVRTNFFSVHRGLVPNIAIHIDDIGFRIQVCIHQEFGSGHPRLVAGERQFVIRAKLKGGVKTRKCPWQYRCSRGV